MADQLESRVDGLYQLPLDEFTKARNALGTRKAESELEKAQSEETGAGNRLKEAERRLAELAKR